ncbi:MAG: DRTGG domain-containing protein [Thermoplasmatota archaeon]
MEKVIIASIRPNSGKTSVIIGMGKAIEGKFGYLKPFGERVLYRKKRLLDYDSALVKFLFDIEEDPEDMSIGFDHSKLHYMYTKDTITEKLREMEASIGNDRDVLFMEAGKDLQYGASVNLDAISLAEHTGAGLVMVISGEDDTIVDDITFLKKYLQLPKVNFKGVIINKVKDVEDFKMTRIRKVQDMGMNILGIIPFRRELTHMSVEYISDALFAKVLAGEAGLSNQVERIFIGAMSGDAALKNPLFSKENKLIITSGDRNDMILAAIESGTSGIVLTNNVLPPSKVISQAESRNIPLLLVSTDTFQTAKQIDDMEKLITRNDTEKVEMLGDMVRNSVDLEGLFG